MKTFLNRLGLLKSPVVINLVFALGLKGTSFLYSMVIVGIASRSLSADDTTKLLVGFNILVPLGLIQVGLGTLVLRAVANAHSRGERVTDLVEVGAAFSAIAILAAIGGLIALPTLYLAGAGYLVPVAGLMITGMACSPIDQFRSGTEQGWISNLFLASSYCVCALVFILARYGFGLTSLWLFAVLSYGATAIANLASFASKLRDPLFRMMLTTKRKLPLLTLFKPSLPIIAMSAASAVLLNIPLSGTVFSWYPSISSDDIVLLRICSLCLNTVVFVLAPVIPTIIRLRTAGTKQEFARAVALYVMGSLVLACTIGTGLWIGGSQVTHLWLGRALIDASSSHEWAAALVVWLLGASAAQYAILVANPWRIAFAQIGCDGIALAVGSLSVLGAAVSVPMTMVVGLCVYLLGSAERMLVDVRKRLKDKCLTKPGIAQSDPRNGT